MKANSSFYSQLPFRKKLSASYFEKDGAVIYLQISHVVSELEIALMLAMHKLPLKMVSHCFGLLN